jgi:diguanylate cyclase (GGDEF)-like protein
LPEAAEHPEAPPARGGSRGLRRRLQAAARTNPLRAFTLWVALPSVVVYAGVCGLVFLVMHMMSDEMNAIDADRGRKAIAAAIESLVLGLGESVADEATWTEAYINTYIQPNPAWLDGTWGATARISDTYDTALLTDKEGNIVFGESSKGAITGTLADNFSGAAVLLKEIDGSVAKLGDDATVEHLVHTADGVSALAGAVVHGNTGQASVPREQRRILWLGKRLDDAMLRDVAHRFQLPLPRLVEHADPGDDSMVLTDADGTQVATVAWQPRRPGDPAFAHSAGIAAVVMLVIGVLVAAVLTAFRSSIRSRAQADERDWQNARFDAVTGLPNSFGLAESLKATMPKRRSATQPVAVALIGIDGFLDVVDSYGRDAGDRLLDTLADIIERESGGRAQIARTGPAELALARAGDDGPNVIRGLATRLLALGSEAVAVDNLKLKIGFSIGVADAEVDRAGIAELIRKAETALARARETGGRQLVDYDPAIEDERRRRIELQADIRRGLDAGEFDLEYQPIIDFGTRSIIGVEALMRWTRRLGGPMSPAVFIPAAERSGLIDDLGMFALRRAVEEIGPLDNLKVSVNVSGVQLRNPALAAAITSILDEWRMPAARLQLEVTESFLVAQPERAKRIIEALREQGILIALDDFGTGYSSIGYLRQFAFDRVKLDRSLVADIDKDAVQSALVESTMVYAFAMGLGVTAEGVERKEEASTLARLGCREFQGYFFAKPMPLPQLTKLLADQQDLLAV